MRTEDLIATLSQDLKPTPSVRQQLLRPAVAGGLIAFVLVAFWLGFRPDILRAWAAPMFWVKAAYTSLIALAGFGCTRILASPIGEPWKGFIAALAIFGILLLGGVVQLALADAVDRLPLLMGGSWHVCSQNIAILGAPILILTLLALRTLAPTKLRATGAAAGLFAGGVAATVYGLHCPEHALAFVAVWYSLGMAVLTAAGALAGPWALRWR